MPPLARHPFGWHYIYIRLVIGLLRTVIKLMRFWKREKRVHEGAVFKRTHIPSRDEGRVIKVHLYQPVDYDNSKPTPVLVNWHGSSFVMPLLGSNREFCSLIAARTQCLVFDADYRKAPEHPFPAALQDAEDIVHYLAANPSQYDTSNIFLCGFSAGGNIALVTSSVLGPERIKGVIAFYAAVDLTKQHTAPEKRVLAGVTIRPFLRDICRDAYMPPSQPRNDPRISVALAPTESFPKHVYVVCGNADAAYDPAAKFVEGLRKAGHEHAEFLGFEYMAHGFDARAKEGTEAGENKRKAYDGAVDLINRAIGVSR